MRTHRRMGIAAAAGVAVVLLTAQQASAGSGSVYAGSGGIAKAAASYGQAGYFKLCANLLQGYSATATMGGNSVTDYTVGGPPRCEEIFNVTSGNPYQLTAIWRGNGGGYDAKSTTVIAD